MLGVCVYPCPTSLFDTGQMAECSQPFIRSFSPTLHPPPPPPLPVFLWRPRVQTDTALITFPSTAAVSSYDHLICVCQKNTWNQKQKNWAYSNMCPSIQSPALLYVLSLSIKKTLFS